MNEFESDWISFESESECSESVFEWIWEKITKLSESRMAVSESNRAEFKMAAIIKLSQKESVKFFFVQNSWIHNGRIQDGCHHQVEWEWVSLSQIELVWVRVFFAKWLNPRWQNSRWLPSSSSVRMNEWSFFCENSGNQSWQVWVSLRRKN